MERSPNSAFENGTRPGFDWIDPELEHEYHKFNRSERESPL
jgi:hypothetical protein